MRRVLCDESPPRSCGPDRASRAGGRVWPVEPARPEPGKWGARSGAGARGAVVGSGPYSCRRGSCGRCARSGRPSPEVGVVTGPNRVVAVTLPFPRSAFPPSADSDMWKTQPSLCLLCSIPHSRTRTLVFNRFCLVCVFCFLFFVFHESGQGKTLFL